MMDNETQRRIFTFIIQTGMRLEARNSTICTASVLTYRALRKEISDDLCPYTLACACLLLAAKLEEDQRVRIRDVLNVAHSVLHEEMPVPQIGEQLWAMREGIARMEYIVLRMLRFRLHVENPHKYLLQYVSSLQHWCPREFTNSGVAAISFILLRDAHVSPAWILSHSPQTIAIVCLAIALRATKITIGVRWYSIFCASMTRSKLRRLEEEFVNKILRR
uniref:Cyclin-related protein n=2 Tax=Ascaris TaxID=6251 RepID=F1LAN0_ASCSU